GAAVVASLHPQPFRRNGLPLLAGALAANCADLDFVLVLLAHDKSWHRGFTHSLGFSLLLTLLALIVWGGARLRKVLAYGAAYTSHGLLDYATQKFGGGVKLLWPLSEERFGLGRWSLSELPSRLPPLLVLRWLAVELFIFAPPLLLIMILRAHYSAGHQSEHEAPRAPA
ncbi:MAG: LexA-binding, inner rane-associated putative hydrolase, partial [Acidobacteriota bacterium]|nr:LexA-binding, inner rane-associated putative hydrolase [Acidobacteriota bacterium]